MVQNKETLYFRTQFFQKNLILFVPKVSYFLSHFLLFKLYQKYSDPHSLLLTPTSAPAPLLWEEKHSCSWTAAHFRKPAQQMNKRRHLLSHISSLSLLAVQPHRHSHQSNAGMTHQHHSSARDRNCLNQQCHKNHTAHTRWLLRALLWWMHLSSYTLHSAWKGSLPTPQSIKLQAKSDGPVIPLDLRAYLIWCT